MLAALVATGLLSWSVPTSPADAAEVPFHAPADQHLSLVQEGWEMQDWQGYGNVRARLWVENDRDFYRSGDRLRVRFSTSEDAHVALIHVDPDGRLDFLFPASPWESDRVRGGRSYSLPRAHTAGLPVSGRSGIGYIYLIASPAPLDYRNFSRARGGPWDWSYAGRMVSGDPFWAMEQISRLLVPGYAPYAADYFSYYVGGRHSYPAYACSDNFRGTRGGWGWSSSYGSCSRLDLFLRQHPHYYDARRYRGDRRAYLARTYGPPPTRHRFKEPAAGSGTNLRVPEQPRRGVTEADRRNAAPSAAPAQRPAQRPAQAQPQERGGERREAAPAGRERPTLERRAPPNPSGARQGTQGETRSARPAAEPERRQPERRQPEPQRERASGSSRGEAAAPARGTRAAPAANRDNDRSREAPAARPASARERPSSGEARNRRPPGDEG
jgi:hypothetical protein